MTNPTILVVEPSPASGPIGISTEQGQKRAVDFSDKLNVINEALINTGNEPVNVGDDDGHAIVLEWRGYGPSELGVLWELMNESCN